MDNLRKVNLVLLVFWVIHSAIITSIVVLGFVDVFSRKGSWAIVEQIIVALVSIPVIILMIKAVNLIRSYTKYDYINNDFTKNLLNKYKFYLYLIMGISFLMASDNGSSFYPGFINIILLCIIPVIVVLSIYKIRIEMQLLNNKQNQNSDVSNSENNNLYQNTISNSNPQPTDTYTYTQSTIPTPEVQNAYQQASMNNTPRVTFDTQSLSNQHNTSPSSITESIKEIQDEYKSNQNPEESLAQKIQNHYQNNVNSQKTKIVSEPNPNKFRNLFFSVLLILGFLAFAFLSLGGIIVGDLTISGVLAVGSFILVIDGYLFYLMWFKK